MKVLDIVFNSMLNGEIVTHYKKGNSNFFLRELKSGDYLFDKVTKGCSCGVCCGDEEKINEYIKSNNLKVVGILKK